MNTSGRRKNSKPDRGREAKEAVMRWFDLDFATQIIYGDEQRPGELIETIGRAGQQSANRPTAGGR